MHKNSQSDINFDALFSHARNDHDDSSCSRNSGQHLDKDSNAENDFKIFMYLEDKNENGDESQESPREFAGKDQQPVQVEKKLDTLFKREVPLTNLYFEKEGESTSSTVKVTSSDQSNYFPPEMGRRGLSRTQSDQGRQGVFFGAHPSRAAARQAYRL